MARGDISAVLDTIEFDPGDAIITYGLHIENDMCIVPYEGVLNDGFVKTFRVAADGTFSAVLDTEEFDPVQSRYCRILKHPGAAALYILMDRHTATGGIRIHTLTVNATTGAISAVIDTHDLEAGANDGMYGDIGHISGNVFQASYTMGPNGGNNYEGRIKTFAVNTDGTIDALPEVDSWNFVGANGCGYPETHHISGTVYMTTHGDPASVTGTAFTHSIANDGTMAKVALDSLDWSPLSAVSSQRVVNVRGNVWCVAYDEEPADTGEMATFTVADDGTMSAILDTATFEVATAKSVGASVVYDGMIAIVYQDVSVDGWVKAYPIAADGTIGAQIDALEFNPLTGVLANLRAVPLYQDLYVVVYRGDLTDGFATSFTIEEDAAPVPVLGAGGLLPLVMSLL